MSLKVLDDCLGCGACEIPCEQGAITQGDDFQIAFVIDPLLCNDCGECIPVCSVDALVEDSEWAVCLGRGCPLSTSRFEDWTCAQGKQLCPECGAVLWRPADQEGWVCPRCDAGMKVICPKSRKVASIGAGA
ncbi:MAG: hypothetical protein DCC49_08185 [Acidobacteria bacterium]|nr:MAG: hypothetical protein DCC49_08185 [Acidobacteriota bacterium]